MLSVQKFLLENGLQALKDKYAIKVTEHPTDDRIILNYHQKDSPKASPITRDCRGLTLDKRNWNLISKSFTRFFNSGESREEDNKFDWASAFVQEKLDGSLLNVFFYEGQWQVQTRGSFGDVAFYPGGPTPEQLFWGLLTEEQKGLLDKHYRDYSFAFELCSRHNKVVRDYETPQLYLLSVFNGEDELPQFSFNLGDDIDGISYVLQIPTPVQFRLSSLKEVQDFITVQGKMDKTWEGCVCKDGCNNRLKIKSLEYLALHRMGSDKVCLFMPKYLISYILEGEEDELLCYYPEVLPKVQEMKGILAAEYALLEATWEALKASPTRKDFALSIPNEVRCKSILFAIWTSGKNLSTIWGESKDYLLKVLF